MPTPADEKKTRTYCECANCGEKFHAENAAAQPRVANCGHSFCTECARKLLAAANGSGVLTCPVDRQPTPCADAAQLALNRPMLELLDAMHKQAEARVGGAAANAGVCICCSQAAAVIYCYNCPEEFQDYCQACFDKEHSSVVQQKHRRVPMSDRPPRNYKCPEHQENLKLFCVADQVPICADCQLWGAHKGHAVRQLQQVSDETRKILQSSADAASTSVDQVHALIHRDADALRSLDDSHALMAEKVREHVRVLEAALRERERLLLDTLQKEHDRRAAQLHVRRKNLAACFAQMATATEEATRSLAKDAIGLMATWRAAEQHVVAARALSAQWLSAFKPMPAQLSVTLPDTVKSALIAHGTIEEGAMPSSELTAVKPCRGAFVRKFGQPGVADGQFNSPQGVLVYGDEVYICDRMNHRIQVFKRLDGTFLRSFGQNVSGDGMQLDPVYAAVLGDELFVVDSSNNRVVVFTRADGAFVRVLGNGAGSADGQFVYPLGIAVTSDYEVLVCDHGNHRVQVFRRDGQFVRKFGVAGNGDGQLNKPFGLHLCGDELYVTEFENGRVQVFNAHDGKYLRKLAPVIAPDGTPGRPYAVATMADEALVVSDLNRVDVFGRDGGFRRQFANAGTGDGELSYPTGICASDGDVFVCDLNNHRIQVFA